MIEGAFDVQQQQDLASLRFRTSKGRSSRVFDSLRDRRSISAAFPDLVTQGCVQVHLSDSTAAALHLPLQQKLGTVVDYLKGEAR